MNACRTAAERKDGRIVIHFDYDCFYASVFEAENPALKSIPLAVQQKQIIVTCNYEARRRGLYKLQLITNAKKVCPEAIIVLGEDLTRFRDASKELYNFIRDFSWNGKVERLGFDEVWMDVTDMVDYNVDVLNVNDMRNSFFHLSSNDPTLGFDYDAFSIAGHTFPAAGCEILPTEKASRSGDDHTLSLRLQLGSHLAQHIRHQLEEHKGYSSTVGISTSKLLSKLVGNLNKPRGQTTLMPPYAVVDGEESNVNTFIDGHDIGKIPYIGFKVYQKLREHVLQRPAAIYTGLVYGNTKEQVTVGQVRAFDGLGPDTLGKLLGGPSQPHDIGARVWCLLNGVDDSEVGQARDVPRQISIEDSYIRLDTLEELLKELAMLTKSLIIRMRADLLEDNEGRSPSGNDSENGNGAEDQNPGSLTKKRWKAHPRTLRLSTRPRPPLNSDGTRSRTFSRISRSAPMPNSVFNLSDSPDAVAERLVSDALIPMFRKLHPEKSGWNLSLVNVAATNMVNAASETRVCASGRDIGRMFRQQDDVLRLWKPKDESKTPPLENPHATLKSELEAERPVNTSILNRLNGFGQFPTNRDSRHLQHEQGPEPSGGNALRSPKGVHVKDVGWNSEDDADELSAICHICGAAMPQFAILAHQRFHTLGD